MAFIKSNINHTLLCFALLSCIVLTGCATSQQVSIAPVTGECNLLGGCEIQVPRTPNCNCYYNADCTGGGIGLRVCMVNPNDCKVNQQSSGKINDGLCTFFWWASLQDQGERDKAGQAFAAFYGVLETSAKQGGLVDGNAILATRARYPDAAGQAMESLAASLVVLIIGRAEYSHQHPHKRGAFHFPVKNTQPDNISYSWASIEKVPREQLTILDRVKVAVQDFISFHNVTALRKALSGLSELSTNYSGYGGCQYPHPSHNHHAFDYQNQFDCLTEQIVHAVETLKTINQLSPEHGHVRGHNN